MERKIGEEFIDSKHFNAFQKIRTVKGNGFYSSDCVNCCYLKVCDEEENPNPCFVVLEKIKKISILFLKMK